MDYFTSDLKVLLYSIMVSIFGGIARIFSGVRQQPLSIQQFIGGSIVSGFAGLMTYYLVRYMNIPEFLMNFLIGMAGFAGPNALAVLTRIYEQKIGINSNTATKE